MTFFFFKSFSFRDFHLNSKKVCFPSLVSWNRGGKLTSPGPPLQDTQSINCQRRGICNSIFASTIERAPYWLFSLWYKECTKLPQLLLLLLPPSCPLLTPRCKCMEDFCLNILGLHEAKRQPLTDRLTWATFNPALSSDRLLSCLAMSARSLHRPTSLYSRSLLLLSFFLPSTEIIRLGRTGKMEELWTWNH